MTDSQTIERILEDKTSLVRAGWHAQQVKIDAILAAYDLVKEDPRARIPSVLMAAIEAAR